MMGSLPVMNNAKMEIWMMETHASQTVLSISVGNVSQIRSVMRFTETA